jgi:hypothetical protein
MQARVIVSWQAQEFEFQEKERSWYWAVAIIATGVAVSAFILANYLFSLIAVIAGFTVMLVGSKKPRERKYQVTERGFFIGTRLIPYRNIRRFAIHEEPRELVLETNTISGTVSVPLGDVDYRAIQMEFRNQDIEEVDTLRSFADHVARGMGI